MPSANESAMLRRSRFPEASDRRIGVGRAPTTTRQVSTPTPMLTTSMRGLLPLPAAREQEECQPGGDAPHEHRPASGRYAARYERLGPLDSLEPLGLPERLVGGYERGCRV